MQVRRPTLEEIRGAANRLQGIAERTPLVRLGGKTGDTEIFLKLENLQPIGSFKLRGAGNAMSLLARDDPGALKEGVCTASAGNMAQGVAWNARRLGIPCRVVVPDHAPANKLTAIERLGGEIFKVPFDDWWQALVERRCPGVDGRFIHPVSEPEVIAGNGTIGLEILEDLPEVETIVVPFGGGGLSCGIAAAAKALKPGTRIIAAEVSTAAPLSASLDAGSPTEVDYEATFVDGIGGRSVLAEMWPLVNELLSGAATSTPALIADAIRLLVERNRVVAEGAGAAAVATALSGKAGTGRIVCVVSGGNIDSATLAAILRDGLVPGESTAP